MLGLDVAVEAATYRRLKMDFAPKRSESSAAFRTASLVLAMVWAAFHKQRPAPRSALKPARFSPAPRQNQGREKTSLDFWRANLGWFAVLLAASGVALGCNDEPSDTTEAGPVSAAPKKHELPPLTLKDDTPNLLLTWIDEKGDFHVVQKISEVPAEGKKQVRVVISTQTEGTGNLVYVADLTQKKPDGSYQVKVMPRSAWDELGADRRKSRLEALAPSAIPPAPAASNTAKLGELVVIVYGADWCKPCHDAERYLKQRGIKVVKKDIDNDNVARKEMQHKLKAANRPTASIPIIDVMGQILVGFSPRAIDRALQAAKSAKPL